MANEFKIKNGFFSEGNSNITGSLNVSAGITGSLFGTASFATTASYALNANSSTTASFALTASNITPAISNDADTRILTANGNGTLNAESLLTFDGTKLSVLYQSGDEGGEMLLSKPVTNTTIAGTGVTFDIYQNKLRFFEQGGSARGYYLDITAGGAGVGTNLASGGGTVTSVGTTGTVNGITLTGGPITGAGTVTLGGTLSGIGNSQLTNSSITIGSTNIALGATSTTLAGLTSVTSTNFTGSLLGTASNAITSLTASKVITQGSLAGGNQYFLIYQSNPAGGTAAEVSTSNLVYNSTTNTLPTTASWATNTVTASYALNALSASFATQALSASFATTASYATRALSSSYALSASHASSTAAISGTTNYVSKFTSGTTIGNSLIYDDGTDVSIGTGTFISGAVLWGPSADYGILSWGISEAYIYGEMGKSLSLGAGGGVDMLYISASTGNVGIGTITPNSKLEVVGNTSISGSLITSGSTGDGINTSTLELLASGVTSIDWGNKELYDTNNYVTVDWEQMILSSPQGGGVTTVYWGANLLKSLNTSMSIDWDTRLAYDSAGTSSIDWGTRALNDSAAFTSLDWENKALYDSSGVGSMGWDARLAVDSNVSLSLDWENRVAFDYLGLQSIDWANRGLLDTSEITSVNWDGRALVDSTGEDSVNWDGRFLLSATSGIKTLNWNSDYYINSPVYQKDNKSIVIQDAVSGLGVSNDTYLGDIIQGSVDGINYPSDGQVVYLDTDGFWYTYDQTDTAIYGKMVGLAFEVNPGSGTCNVLLEGHVLIDGASPSVQGVDHGLPVYIKDTSTTGEMSTIIPSSGIVQVLGHCYYQNTTTSSNWMMKFRPSMDWYKV
jgi:hypothetical protein